MPDAPHEAVEAAARAAQAHEFILELPQEYDTVVGERGMTLSGGQRQRIAIARALLIDPRILVLDDATASVDATTEARIRAGLQEVMRDRTTIIIAHRLSTIALADEIVVLDHGRVAARGTQSDLLVERALPRDPRARAAATGGRRVSALACDGAADGRAWATAAPLTAIDADSARSRAPLARVARLRSQWVVGRGAPEEARRSMKVWQAGSHLTDERGARVDDWSWRQTRRRLGVLVRLARPYRRARRSRS